MTLGFEATSAVEVDLLEDPLDGNPHAQVAPSVVTADLADGTIGLSMRSFQVATLRLGRNR
jgi:alpha-mannosidase